MELEAIIKAHRANLYVLKFQLFSHFSEQGYGTEEAKTLADNIWNKIRNEIIKKKRQKREGIKKPNG